MKVKMLKYPLVLIPCIVFFIIISCYAVNIPDIDDYDAILDFLCSYKLATGIDHFFLLFNQQNEHRLLASKAMYVLYYYLFNGVNFRSIIFLGDLQLVVILAILTSFIRQVFPTNWFPLSLILSICLFDLNNWENADFAMAAMQNFGIIMLFLISLYFYNKDKKWGKYVGALFQVITLFSSGNGLMAGLVLCFFNIMKKDRLGMILSIVTFAIFTPMYFIHYQHPETAPNIELNPVKLTKFTLYYLSGHVLFRNYLVAVAAGVPVLVALLLSFPFQKRTFIKKEMLPLACTVLFVLMSMAIVIVFRGYITSRYRIYPDILLPIIVIFICYKLNGRRMFNIVSTISIVLLLLVYINNMNDSIKNLANLKKDLTHLKYVYPSSIKPDNIRGAKFAEKSCELQIYCIEQHRQ